MLNLGITNPELGQIKKKISSNLEDNLKIKEEEMS